MNFYLNVFVKPNKYFFSLCVLAFLFVIYANLSIPYLVRNAIDFAFNGKTPEQSQVALIKVVFDLLCLYVIKGLASYTYQIIIGRCGNRCVVNIRQSLFRRIIRIRMDYFAKSKQGELMALFSEDLGAFNLAITSALTDFVLESIGVICLVGVMLWMSWQLTIVTILVLPIIAVMNKLFKVKLSYYGEKILNIQAEVSTLLQTFVTCVRVVFSYTREDYEMQRFKEVQLRAMQVFLKLQKYRAALLSMSETLAMFGMVGIVLFGRNLIVNDKLTIGFMCAFLVYLINLPVSVKKITDAVTALRLGKVAYERIHQVFGHPEDVPSGTMPITGTAGELEFHNVSYGYGADYVLRDINLKVSPGEFVAVVGPSGAGKSTIASLIMRFQDIQEGQLLFDGEDVRTYNRDEYRRSIGYIQQEAVLFNTTVEANIRYGNDKALFADVVAAAELANAAEFINEMPLQYQTNIGNYGGRLSGGQRQRMAIARAMVEKPQLLVFDEPTAALDGISEQQVFAAIRKASIGSTAILITHNYKLLSDNDRVVCLENGRIIEDGKHRELLEQRGYYYQLWSTSSIDNAELSEVV